MFFCLYETKNTITGDIYVGVHKTSNLNDDYLGSGKVIRAAIKKYGSQNFIKTILATFDTPEEMYAKEAEIVTDEFLARPDTYNIRRGGSGGFDFINKTGLNHKGFETAAERNRHISPFKIGHHFNDNISTQTRKKLSLAAKNRRHTEETKKKISLSQIGHAVSNESRLLMSQKASLSQLGKKRGPYKKKLMERESDRRAETTSKVDCG
jgi:hypothetical protein